MSGGGGGKGNEPEMEVISTAPKWLSDLGEWSVGKFRENMEKPEGENPYSKTSNPYGTYKSLFGGTGQDYLENFSAAPKAAYQQALADTKDIFGAQGTYGSVGNGLMSGAMANAGSQYATSMSKAQQDAQTAMLRDYTTSAMAQDWANTNTAHAAGYADSQKQQHLSNLLNSMGVSIPAIMQGQAVVQDSGDGGKGGGLGSMIGTGAQMGMTMFSSRAVKEHKRPAEDVLDKVLTLPVERWNYTPGHGDDADHIGPYAEDWARRFGGSATRISVIDAIGVLLKAVQELTQKISQLEIYISKL